MFHCKLEGTSFPIVFSLFELLSQTAEERNNILNLRVEKTAAILMRWRKGERERESFWEREIEEETELDSEESAKRSLFDTY